MTTEWDDLGTPATPPIRPTDVARRPTVEAERERAIRGRPPQPTIVDDGFEDDDELTIDDSQDAPG